MKRLNLICLLFFLIQVCVFSQFKLSIEIVEFRNNTGNVMLQLLGTDEKIVTQKMGQINEKTYSVGIENLKPGRYAVRYYHDENMNMKMETNLVGKPTEGYGFSNNVTGKFGPPPFEKWLFELKEDKKIVLRINY